MGLAGLQQPCLSDDMIDPLSIGPAPSLGLLPIAMSQGQAPGLRTVRAPSRPFDSTGRVGTPEREETPPLTCLGGASAWQIQANGRLSNVRMF